MVITYTWEEFEAYPHLFQEKVKAFWKPGYDYRNPFFWQTVNPAPAPDFIRAVQMYDYLKNACILRT